MCEECQERLGGLGYVHPGDAGGAALPLTALYSQGGTMSKLHYTVARMPRGEGRDS